MSYRGLHAQCVRIASVALIAGCVGNIESSGRAGGGLDPIVTGGATGTPPVGPAGPILGGASGTTVASLCAGAPSPGPAPIRRLNRFEYDNTIRDLIGDASGPATGFPEEVGLGFSNDAASQGFSQLLIEAYASAARKAASFAIGDAARLRALLGCDPASAGEEPCARRFIDSFGARAFRRPLSADESGDLLAVFRAVRPGGGFNDAIAAVIETALQSPQFLYRVELGVATATPGVARLDPYEIASRLSYLFWGTMPDAELFAAAADGRLAGERGIAAQATRLLADPRARAVARYFHDALFGLPGIDGVEKNAAKFPGYTPDLRPLMREEAQRFLDHVVWDGAGDLGSLLTAPYSFVNRQLALYYGARGGVGRLPAGASFERVELDPGKRAGILTHPGVIAKLTPGSESDPTVRGVFVRKQLLCSPPPPPPPGLNVMPPVPDPNLTTREQFAAHSQDPACAGCHRLIDPIGYGLEGYDAVGLHRTTENGKPVDVRGELVDTDVDGPFVGAVELAAKLARSRQVEACVASHWFTFAYARSATAADACTRAMLEQALAGSGGRIRELLAALAGTPAFLYRPAQNP